LKENVIIGRLIPARLDQTPEGRERLGVKEGEREAGRLTGFTQAPPATFEEALAAIGGGDLVGAGAEKSAPAGGDAAAAAAAAVTSTETPKSDDGLLAAVSALADTAKASDDLSDSGDDDAAKAAEALRASTSTAEENVEPAPQFVDEGGDDSEGDKGDSAE